MTDSKLVRDIVSEIERIAGKLGLEPSRLGKAQFKELSKISEWDLRKVGGYATLLSTYYPVADKSLKDIQLMKARKSYVSGLEKKYGSWELFQEQLTESLGKHLKTLKIAPVILNEKATKSYIKTISKRELHDSTPRS